MGSANLSKKRNMAILVGIKESQLHGNYLSIFRSQTANIILFIYLFRTKCYTENLYIDTSYIYYVYAIDISSSCTLQLVCNVMWFQGF